MKKTWKKKMVKTRFTIVTKWNKIHNEIYESSSFAKWTNEKAKVINEIPHHLNSKLIHRINHTFQFKILTLQQLIEIIKISEKKTLLSNRVNSLFECCQSSYFDMRIWFEANAIGNKPWIPLSEVCVFFDHSASWMNWILLRRSSLHRSFVQFFFSLNAPNRIIFIYCEIESSLF